ncbi:hypothetical protein NDU88_003028 [Pleurodeles waltl]|uniref:Uncharacterized protein n=1 Tax=Pleurodeles waltl TaxID=8319 RepID=A0AAV7UBD2_PLEWA|nr:hypothetical protein NDU88_003028 [Pleurodeles waltl]
MLRSRERGPAKAIAVKSPKNGWHDIILISEIHLPKVVAMPVECDRWLGRNLCVSPATAENQDGGRARVPARLSSSLGEKRTGGLRPRG